MMPADRQAIERIVIDALTAVSPDKSIAATRETEVLELVDSLGLIMALGKIQAALHVSLGPQQLIGIFRCRSIADVVLALEAPVPASS